MLSEIKKAFTSGELYRLRKYGIYVALLREYRKYFPRWNYVLSVHRKGFTVSDWEILNLTSSDYEGYLSTKRYHMLHPVNGFYSQLIDDKMIIKYVFSGTPLHAIMPEYYYIIDEYGLIHPMMDLNPDLNLSSDIAGTQDIRRLLEEKKVLAFKVTAGSVGAGFFKVEFRDGKTFVNTKCFEEAQFEAFLKGLRNYIICEYLVPHPDLARFWPKASNSIRYLYCQVEGEWRMIKSYIRFGTEKTGQVENFNRGGILCYINEEGSFCGGYQQAVDGQKNCSVKVDRHPDTGSELTGVIPCWDELQGICKQIGQLLPQTRFLGFDFVITDKYQVKLLEINSLTSLDTIQLDRSILDTPNGKWFFSSVLPDVVKE